MPTPATRIAVTGAMLAGCSESPPLTATSPVDGQLRPQSTSRHYVTEGDQTAPPDAPSENQIPTDIVVMAKASYNSTTGQALGTGTISFNATDWTMTVDLTVKDENNSVVGTDQQVLQDGSYLMSATNVDKTAKYVLDKGCDRSWHVGAAGKVWNSYMNPATGGFIVWGTKKDSDSDDSATRLCDDPPPDDHNPCDDPTTVAEETCDSGGGPMETSQYTTDEPTVVAYTSSSSGRQCDGGILWFSSFDGGATWRIDYFECTHWVENQE